MKLCLLLAALLWCSVFTFSNCETVKEYLSRANEDLRVNLTTLVNAQWNHDSNITDENKDELKKISLEFDEFRKEQSQESRAFFNSSDLDPDDKRQLEKIAVIGMSALDVEDATKLKDVQLSMETIYSSATVTVDNKPNLELEPDLTELMATSTNEKQLREAWVNWRDATGKKMRDYYITYYKLGNKAAQKNQIDGIGTKFEYLDDLWMFSWDQPGDELKKDIEILMEDLSDLYKKIHAYVRFHLKSKYEKVMPEDGTIPAHLLGNMWAQQWSNILNTITDINPNKDVGAIDSKVNENLKKWTVKQMFEISEKFFADLGMDKMTDTFRKKSIITKQNVTMTCHASAWDFYEKDDFRIKQCTDKTMSDLVTVHHEMGHIQYFMEYSKQKTVYREGANPGVHEAIGDLIALSVSTPEHLSKINLLNKTEIESDIEKINLNYQMKMALDKIVFLPFSYVMDKWRWDVFRNPDMESSLNKHWWNLTIQYQGISPPVKRSEKDFDPGAKYHIAAGVEYVRYFASHVLQFQFYKHMCGNSVKDLYKCDFDSNKEAAKSLINMLQKGSSDTWMKILEETMGFSKMSLDPLKEYFKPLNDYLDNFIKENNITVGWNEANVDEYFENSSFKLAHSYILILLPLCIYLFRL